MKNPHEFATEIEPDDVVKLRGEIDETEQSFYGEVFNIEPTEKGVAADLNTHALPSNEFYTLLLHEQASADDPVDMEHHTRGDSPVAVGNVREIMVYEPRE